MALKSTATIEDLLAVDGKAELVDGDVVIMSPTGGGPSYAAGEVFASLRDYVKRTKMGRAVPDNAAFVVSSPARRSFSPDAAYYIGPDPGMRFFDGPPALAVEVRSEHDYGAAAEKRIAAKRSAYFAAGTLVVWDVDLLHEDVVRVYRAAQPTHATVYRRGDMAEAEPAVPEWLLLVDDLFPL